MPTKKVQDWSYSIMCRDPDHDPPTMMVFEPGTYEHECRACGRVVRFTVGGVTWATGTTNFDAALSAPPRAPGPGGHPEPYPEPGKPATGLPEALDAKRVSDAVQAAQDAVLRGLAGGPGPACGPDGCDPTGLSWYWCPKARGEPCACACHKPRARPVCAVCGGP